MNEQFRVAQKLGLMFLPNTSLPKDISSWTASQLHVESPALGIKQVKWYSHKPKVIEWPQSLQPNLQKRDEMFWALKENMEKHRRNMPGFQTKADKNRNRQENLMEGLDALKFAHRNVYGEDQLRLRLNAFWANHFRTANIFDNGNHIGHVIEEGILANLNGDFSNLLYKVTSHPAMLIYLDNTYSAGPNSLEVQRAKRNGRQAGLNDNLGRELLELHTVSPTANYTEEDIKGAAKVLAGWGAEPGRVSGDKLISLAERNKEIKKRGGTLNSWDYFKSDFAEPGNKTIMGKTFGEGKGALRKLTDFLAGHEHTIKYISFKLAQHFVSDNPSQSDLDYIESAWKSSNGNLDKIHTAVIERAIASTEPKFQWPMTWLFQVIRLSGANGFKGWEEEQSDDYNENIMSTNQIFEELGQGFWLPGQPNGYSSDKSEWLSGEMFERRIRFATSLYTAGSPTQKVENIINRIGANKSTRELIDSVSGNQKKFVALMCSPELMGLKSA